MLSALPRQADIRARFRQVRLVPHPSIPPIQSSARRDSRWSDVLRLESSRMLPSVVGGPDAWVSFDDFVGAGTLALGMRLPTIYNVREFVEAGGLMSYGPNFLDLYELRTTTASQKAKGPASASPFISAVKCGLLLGFLRFLLLHHCILLLLRHRQIGGLFRADKRA